MFKVGDRVQWKQRKPVVCVSAPCDPTPGTVVRITEAQPGELRGGFLVGDSGLVVSVQHDNETPFPPMDWPAESLEYEDRSPGLIGMSEEKWCASLGKGLPQCKHDKPLSDSTLAAIAVGTVVGTIGLGTWLSWRAAKKEQAELEAYQTELASMNQEKLLRELNEWQFQNRGVQDNTNTLVFIGYMMFFSTMFAARG